MSIDHRHAAESTTASGTHLIERHKVWSGAIMIAALVGGSVLVVSSLNDSGPTPAGVAGASATFPLRSGGWRLDGLTVTNAAGDFAGAASIAYEGPSAWDNLSPLGIPRAGGTGVLSVTIVRNGKAVGTLSGSAADVPAGELRTVPLTSADSFKNGPFTYVLESG